MMMMAMMSIAYTYDENDVCRCAIIFWTNHDTKQDKVNYAVSEREDRVTDLTWMMGSTGMYWAATGLY